jgi:hypothetical protein
MDHPGNRLEIQSVEGERIDQTIPSDDIERMAPEGVLTPPIPIAQFNDVGTVGVDGIDPLRASQVPFAERGSQAELAVGVHVSTGETYCSLGLDDQQVGLVDRIEFDLEGRASGDHQVIEIPERDRAEHAHEPSGPGSNKPQFILGCVAIEVLLFKCRSGASDADIGVLKQG